MRGTASVSRASFTSFRRLGLAGLGLAVTLTVAVVPMSPSAAHRPSHEHHEVPTPAGVDEQQLFAVEKALLGEAHALEHAAQRRHQSHHGSTSGAHAGTSARVGAAVADPAAAGSWQAPFDVPVFAIHAALLPTGKVLMFGFKLGESAYENATLVTSQAFLWDPALGTARNAFKQVDPPIDPGTGQPVDLWCGGNSFLADGQLLVAGGNAGSPNGGITWRGIPSVHTFDPFTETWKAQPSMRRGRWYPSQLRMADGRSVVMSGMDETGSGAFNPDVEVFTPPATRGGTGSIRQLNTVLGGWFQPPGTLFYPRMHLLRSGRGLVAGPNTPDTWLFGSPDAAGNLPWWDVPNSLGDHYYGTSVTLPGGPQGPTGVMQIGGGWLGFSGTATETWDETLPWWANGWTAQSPLNIARGHHNTVNLPDGSLVTVGGGTGGGLGFGQALFQSTEAHKQVELWDPATKTWRLGAAQVENRAYHSTALLLPDGRVWSAGDNRNGGTDRDTAEIYSPPYLFRGARPSISSAPTEITINARFTVGTPDRDVTRAVLVAPGATTHGVDMNQRHIELRVTGAADGTGIGLQAPANANAAPPGYYMLFLLNDDGVPSVSRFVRLR